jgi:hypothetical protein
MTKGFRRGLLADTLSLQIYSQLLQSFTSEIDIPDSRLRVKTPDSGFVLIDLLHKSKAPLHGFRRRCPVPFLRSFRPNSSSPTSHIPQNFRSKKSRDRPRVVVMTSATVVAIVVAILTTLPCFATSYYPQDPSQSPDNSNSQTDQAPASNPPQEPPQTQNQNQAAIKLAPVTIPAGTMISLVLTHSIQSRYIHRGDPIYTQITFPVNSGNAVVIPAGTFVQGVVDRLDQSHGRAELHLQSMSITFPDGYVAPIAGPVTLETAEGYTLKDPGSNRGALALGLIGGGAGVGALIGHSVGSPSSVQTITTPPGCTGSGPQRDRHRDWPDRGRRSRGHRRVGSAGQLAPLLRRCRHAG